MLVNAFTLAALTVTGFFLVYKKLPRWLRRACEKYGLITDMLALVGVYFMFGQTATALLAAAIVGICVSALLNIAKDKEKYLYLYDLKDFLSQKTKAAAGSLHKLGQELHARNKPQPEAA